MYDVLNREFSVKRGSMFNKEHDPLIDFNSSPFTSLIWNSIVHITNHLHPFLHGKA
jgi:predicted nicotinamide N-methyase